MTRFTFVLPCCALLACGSTPNRPALAERPAGCAVQLSYGSPTVDTTNLGVVTATCSEDIAEAACLRELQDEVCKLGGDVVWGVSEKPERVGDKNKYTGRAAITKAAGTPAKR